MFSANEQEFYAERGFAQEPQRCKPCRDARKNSADKRLQELICKKCNKKELASRQGGGMTCKSCGAIYSADDRLSMECMETAKGNKLFISFTAKCSECGKETGLPFEPKTGKPIVCGDCFNKKKWVEQGLCRFCGGQGGT